MRALADTNIAQYLAAGTNQNTRANFGMPVADILADSVGVSSYSDAGQSPPEFAGSILARGYVDNMAWLVESRLRIVSVRLEGGEIDKTISLSGMPLEYPNYAPFDDLKLNVGAT